MQGCRVPTNNSNNNFGRHLACEKEASILRRFLFLFPLDTRPLGRILGAAAACRLTATAPASLNTAVLFVHVLGRLVPSQDKNTLRRNERMHHLEWPNEFPNPRSGKTNCPPLSFALMMDKCVFGGGHGVRKGLVDMYEFPRASRGLVPKWLVIFKTMLISADSCNLEKICRSLPFV